MATPISYIMINYKKEIVKNRKIETRPMKSP